MFTQTQSTKTQSTKTQSTKTQSGKTNAAKKLLLAATFLTPLLLAMTGGAFAQSAPGASGDTTTQATDEATSTANELGNMDFGGGDNDPGDVLNGVPGETPVLAAGDAAEAKDTPPFTVTSVSVTRVAHDCFWWNLVDEYDGYTDQHRTYEIKIGPDPACAQPQTVFVPGVDWVRPEANGNTFIHHTDGTLELKNKDGKVIAVIPPAAFAPPPHEEPKQAHEESKERNDRPASNNEHAQKTGTSEAPRQAKLEQNRTESRTATVDHAARTDQHATKTALTGKTSAATTTRSHVKTMSNFGHSAIGTSRMASLAHTSSMMSHLGGGMMHMGGIHMGGMHMAGMHMGKR